ncbi:ATP-binding protein [Gordonia sp. NPDC003424]
MTLIGRDREMGILAEAHASALDGAGGLVMVGGEPGIGKTTLLGGFAESVREAGGIVATGHCIEEVGRPAYQPWRHIQQTLVDDGSIDAATAPIREDVDAFESALFDDAVREFTTVAARQDIVLIIEDLHNADRETVSLLLHLAGHLPRSRLLVVVSFRPVDAQLASAIADLVPEVLAHALEISLPPLDETAVRDMLVDAGMDADDAAPILSRTAGNALFVATTIRLLRAGTDSIDAAVPFGIRQAVRRQVQLAARLHASVPAVVDAAAVIGGEFRLSLLRRLCGAPDLNGAIDVAIRIGLFQEIASSIASFRFTHAVVRMTVYADIPPGRRAAMHAAALDADDLLEPDEAAFHAVRGAPAGTADRAVDLVTAAARRAEKVYAFSSAAAHYRDAVAVAELASHSTPQQRCDLLTDLARAGGQAGDHLEAQRAGLAAATIAQRSGDVVRRARALLAAARSVPFLDEDDRLLAAMDESLAHHDEDFPVERALLLARRAVLATSRDDLAVRDRDTAEAVALVDDRADAVRFEVLAARLHALWGSPAIGDRTADARRLVRVATTPHTLMQARLWMLYHHLAGANIVAAQQEIGSIDEIAARTGWSQHALYARSRRATVDTATGDFDHARAMGDAAYATGVLAREPEIDAVRWGGLFALGWHVDLPAADRTFLREVAEGFLDSPVRRVFHAALAALDVQDAAMDSARGHFRDATSGGLREIPPDPHRLWLLALVCWLAGPLDEPESAREAAALLAPYEGQAVVVGGGVQWMGLVGHYRGLAAAAYGDTESAHRLLTVARATYDDIGARPWSVHAARDLRGGRGDATAESLARQLGMRTPSADTRLSLSRDGELWRMRYRDRELILRDSLGLQYLHQLVVNPGREMSAVDLAGAEVGTGAQDVLDDRAKAEYRSRVEDLRAELESAERDNDIARSARIRTELDFLIDELAGAAGLGGRARRLGSAAERHRLNVTRAIRSALVRITRQDAELGELLSASVHTGNVCVYEPFRR